MLKNIFEKIVSSVFALALSSSFYVHVAGYNNVLKKAKEGNPNFGTSKIYDIALLTAHDSLSDKININSQNDYSTNVPNFCGLENTEAAKKIAINYAKAQPDSLDIQLKSGVRYIDARITCVDGIFYTKHSLLSGKLEDYLKELLNFLVNNPGEFVIFDIASYNETEKSEDQLAEYMKTVKISANGREYNIYDFINYDTSKDFSEITYNDVTKNGTSAGLVIVANVFQRSPNEENKVTIPSLRDFFKFKAKYDYWHNESSSSDLISKIDDVALSYEKNKYVGFKCNQVQTSPDAASIIASPTGSLIENAKKHNVAVLESPHFNYWLSVMPVMWFDNVTSSYGNFNSRINEKILAYNLNLNNTKNSQFKIRKLTNNSELSDNLKILIKIPFVGNGFFGNSLDYSEIGNYKSNKFVLNDNVKEFWKLVKSGSGWKIMLPNGNYLKRVSEKLKTTNSKNSATTFKISISDTGISKIYEDTKPNRNVYYKGTTMDLSMLRNCYKFEIYEVK